VLQDQMAACGWPGAPRWARRANRIAPTIVGGSKKHGGGDLGPTRAKRAWAELGVDGLGIADTAPGPGDDPALMPRLTCEMIARLQGWHDDWGWQFTGRKTARYRQLGNAFPPPVAQAVGAAIRRALLHEGTPQPPQRPAISDPVYVALRTHGGFMTAAQIAIAAADVPAGGTREVRRRIADLSRDFEVDTAEISGQTAYRLGRFKAFLGQRDHERHQRFLAARATIS
jgi:DNA (cytosine-5)-methyltransferase 1